MVEATHHDDDYREYLHEVQLLQQVIVREL